MERRSEHIYEIEFEVPGQHREAYDVWLEADALEWIAFETVDGFEVHRNPRQSPPWIRFVFEFDSLRRWVKFFESAETERTMDALNAVSTDLQKTLWERDSVSLSGPSEGTENTQMTDQIRRDNQWLQN
jgi:hypothetical protein